MPNRFHLTEDDLLERLAWGLYRSSDHLRFGPRRRAAELESCKIVARHQVEELRRSGVLVDEFQREERDSHSMRNPDGREG